MWELEGRDIKPNFSYLLNWTVFGKKPPLGASLHLQPLGRRGSLNKALSIRPCLLREARLGWRWERELSGGEALCPRKLKHGQPPSSALPYHPKKGPQIWQQRNLATLEGRNREVESPLLEP